MDIPGQFKLAGVTISLRLVATEILASPTFILCMSCLWWSWELAKLVLTAGPLYHVGTVKQMRKRLERPACFLSARLLSTSHNNFQTKHFISMNFRFISLASHLYIIQHGFQMCVQKLGKGASLKLFLAQILLGGSTALPVLIHIRVVLLVCVDIFFLSA